MLRSRQEWLRKGVKSTVLHTNELMIPCQIFTLVLNSRMFKNIIMNWRGHEGADGRQGAKVTRPVKLFQWIFMEAMNNLHFRFLFLIFTRLQNIKTHYCYCMGVQKPRGGRWNPWGLAMLVVQCPIMCSRSMLRNTTYNEGRGPKIWLMVKRICDILVFPGIYGPQIAPNVCSLEQLVRIYGKRDRVDTEPQGRQISRQCTNMQVWRNGKCGAHSWNGHPTTALIRCWEGKPRRNISSTIELIHTKKHVLRHAVREHHPELQLRNLSNTEKEPY